MSKIVFDVACTTEETSLALGSLRLSYSGLYKNKCNFETYKRNFEFYKRNFEFYESNFEIYKSNIFIKLITNKRFSLDARPPKDRLDLRLLQYPLNVRNFAVGTHFSLGQAPKRFFFVGLSLTLVSKSKPLE